jgi:hypothetical protein
VEATKHGKGIGRKKENNLPLATASRKVGGPGNTLRSRLIIDSVSGRHIWKCVTLNGTAEDRLARHMLSDCKSCGLTMADTWESASQFVIKNGISHKFNLEK